MRYGYARISTDDQNLDRQRIALGHQSCQEVIEETQSRVKARHRLDALIARLTSRPAWSRAYDVDVKTLRTTLRADSTMSERMQSPSIWLYHTPMTEPAVHKAQIESFPADASSLGRIVQNLLVHSEWLNAYGIDQSSMPAMSRATLPVSERLDRLISGFQPNLGDQRTVQQREGGTCRDFALTLCSFLRVQGIPARMRCGFASYFGDGWEDHWVCEYWNGESSGWCLADPQLDDVLRDKLAVTFDPFNMPREVFVAAGEAWGWCRSGQEDPTRFGHGDMKGLWFVGVNVVRDYLTVNGQETSPWDRWREATAEQRVIAANDLTELDRIARHPETEAGMPSPPWLEVPLQRLPSKELSAKPA